MYGWAGLVKECFLTSCHRLCCVSLRTRLRVGNIVISDLFSRFLELVLSEVAEISTLAAALAVPMRFCSHTSQLIRSARQLHGCRSALS